MNKLILLFIVLAGAALANQGVGGFCEQGNIAVLTSGLPSTTTVQGSFPSCTVSVFTAGTTNLITIFADNVNTPLSNPFTANTSGRWLFYSASNQRVDIQLSGGGLPSPWKITDVILNDPNGGVIAPSNFNGIRIVDGVTFAKSAVGINAADANLGATVGEIWITPGTTTATDTQISIASGHTLRIFGQVIIDALNKGPILLGGTAHIACTGNQGVANILNVSAQTNIPSMVRLSTQDGSLGGMQIDGCRVDAAGSTVTNGVIDASGATNGPSWIKDNFITGLASAWGIFIQDIQSGALAGTNNVHMVNNRISATGTGACIEILHSATNSVVLNSFDILDTNCVPGTTSATSVLIQNTDATPSHLRQVFINNLTVNGTPAAQSSLSINGAQQVTVKGVSCSTGTNCVNIPNSTNNAVLAFDNILTYSGNNALNDAASSITITSSVTHYDLQGATTTSAFYRVNNTFTGTNNLSGPLVVTGTDTGTQTISGNKTFSGTNALSGPLTITGTDSGTQTISGNKSFSGTSAFSGPITQSSTSTFTGAVTAGSFNTELYVATGAQFTTLASAISACPAAGCIIHDNLPETFASDPFSGVGLTKAIHVFMGPGVWLTNAQITLPGPSMIEGSLIRANDSNSPALGTTIKAGASFPVSTALIKMTGTQGNVITKLGVDCNGVAGSTGIFATDINEKGGVRELLITNCVSFGLNVDASQFTSIPAQNYFIQNVECFPNANGTFGSASTDCVHLKGNGGGGPGPVAQITGSGTSGHVIGNTLSLENFSQGIISEIHGEQVTNVIAMLNAGVTQVNVIEATTAGACTSLINIPNTVTGNTWTFQNLAKGSCTNTINDVPDGVTDTSPQEAMFIVGPGSIGSREIYGTSNGIFKVIVGGPTFLGNIVLNNGTNILEGTNPGTGAGKDLIYGDSTAHRIIVANNNGTTAPLITAAGCTTSQRTETASDTNLLTCPTVAQAGSYRLRFVLSVSAANAATLGWQATWTDSNGNLQNTLNMSLYQANNGTPAISITTSGATNLYGYADVDVNNSGSNIIIKLLFSGTSFTAKASASVERIF